MRRQRAAASWRRISGVARDTGWTGASEVVKLVTGLVVLNVLIVGLGPAGYGRYVAVQALSSILMMLSSVWVVFLLLQHALQAERGLRSAFSGALGLAVPASAIAFAIGCLLGPVLIPSLPFTVIAAFVGAELLGGVLLLLSAAAVQVDRGLPAATRIRLLQTITKVVVVLGVAVAGRADLEALSFGLLAGYATVGTATFLWTTHTLGLSRLPGRPTWRSAKEGLPYAGVLASLAVQEDSDKVFLVRFADPVDAGLYAAAYRIVQLGFIPVNAIMGSSHPRFLSSTPGLRNEHLRRALRYTYPTALYGLVATVALVVLAPIVPRFFGSDYEGTPALLAVLAPLVLLRSLSLFPLNALLGLQRFGLRFFVILGCTVLNVCLNGALIPVLGVEGAVISTLVTESVLVLVAWSAVLRAQRRHDQRDAAAGGAQEPSGSVPTDAP